MVHLRTVPTAFHARVLAARLGSDGILAELRGAVDGVYPLGDVMVFVEKEDLETAQELLLADEVESAFEDREPEAEAARRRSPWATWVALAVLVAMWSTLLVRAF